MGEIFRRETAAHPEPFTGERLTTAVGGQVQIEHYHRYLFARSLVTGLDVLDVASGEGYGSALLAQVARSVIGVEYSSSTVVAAAGNFPRPNLHFLQGDARALPLADACVDVAVSFETIEHFDRQRDFLREIHRVLRPGGCFVVSTPDRDIYSPAGAAANPFHVHELSGSEFTALLRDASATCHHAATGADRFGSACRRRIASTTAGVRSARRRAFRGMRRIAARTLSGRRRVRQRATAAAASLYVSRGDVDTDLINAMTL